MFKRVLIANRGEIACRIAGTLRAMGITPIAVYSEADRGALHARSAAEAVPIGAADPRESYLNVAALLTAAKVTRAEAIHPGYGFLAENAEFAAAVEGAGLAFIGPAADQIRALGDKRAARQDGHMRLRRVEICADISRSIRRWRGILAVIPAEP